MDSLVTAAARALAAGDPLAALDRVALREDPPALALRGIAMAQLGEYTRASELLRRAHRAFGSRERLARARCLAALAEVALAERDFRGSARPLDDAARTLEALGDRANALHARLVAARRLLLLGRVDDADAALAKLVLTGAPPALVAIAELARAEVALRRIQPEAARAAIARARAAADGSRIGALVAEVGRASETLAAPCARRIGSGASEPLTLDGVRNLLESSDVVVDACSRSIRREAERVSLARRPVLFALARTLAEAWPNDASREELALAAFDAKRLNESHRARLRVEIGRLRRLLARMARIEATARGFRLVTPGKRSLAVLAPPIDGQDAQILALLADGQAWSTAALAEATGTSQRTAQRALSALEASERVRSIGAGPRRRWLAPPLVGFATTLLLPGPPALG